MSTKQKRNADGTFKAKQPRGPDGRFGSTKNKPIHVSKHLLTNEGRDWYHDKVYTAVKKKQKQPQKPKGKGKGRKAWASADLNFVGRVAILGRTGSGKIRYGLTIPYEFSDMAGMMYGQDCTVIIDRLNHVADEIAQENREKELKPILLHS